MASFQRPKENVAEKQVIAVQDAQTRIKQVIVTSYRLNTSKQQMTAEIRSIINQTLLDIQPTEREKIRYSLAQSAQKWEYFYRRSMQVVNTTALKAIELAAKYNPEVRNIQQSYNIDLNTMVGLHPKETNQIIQKFRNELVTNATGQPIIKYYDKIVKKEIQKLSLNQAELNRIDKNGKPYRVNMRNFAEMRTRHEANLQDIAKYAEDEKVDLVWTSSHADASARCQPYQGKLYSISGKSGMIDGIKYTPLDKALKGPRGDGNGIINGYNCRHTLIPYTRNSRAPQQYSEAQVKRENQVNNKQRLYERNIRNLKIQEKALRANGSTKVASQFRKRWQKQTQEYRQYSLVNKRPFYDWRTRVTKDEVDIEVPREQLALAAEYSIPVKIAKKPTNIANIEVSHKIAQGVDMVDAFPEEAFESFKFDDSQGDIIAAVKAQGYDGKPRIVTKEEFEKLKQESGFIAFRGYSDPDKEKADKYRKEFESGEFYVKGKGGSVHGQGLYCGYSDLKNEGVKTSKYEQMQEFTPLRIAKQYSNSYNKNTHSKIDTMTFTKDFKSINSQELEAEFQNVLHEKFQKEDLYLSLPEEQKKHVTKFFKADHELRQHKSQYITGDYNQWRAKRDRLTRKVGNALSNMDNEADLYITRVMNIGRQFDAGVKATALGYDGIDIPEAQYRIILNRTKVILLGDEGDGYNE